MSYNLSDFFNIQFFNCKLVIGIAFNEFQKLVRKGYSTIVKTTIFC